MKYPNMEQDLSSRFVPISDEKAFNTSSSSTASSSNSQQQVERDFHKKKITKDRGEYKVAFRSHESWKKRRIPRENSFVVCFEKVPMNSLLTIIAHKMEDRGVLSSHNLKQQSYENTKNFYATLKKISKLRQTFLFFHHGKSISFSYVISKKQFCYHF